ncbi:MAG: hypothetical protein M1816_003387 [Peltula sp. TS41687]|nr:MAG: hypothetical protein M1816_003387 [Peltula sp. TS41687]
MSQSFPSLWNGFEKLWSSTMSYPIKDFAFTPGKTPMATLAESTSMIALYYVVIFGGREIMRKRPAFELKMPFMIHNFYLTIISASLLALFVGQLAPTLLSEGVYCSVCNKAAGWTNGLEVLYYLNYLTKYLEFIDTVFLVLKKKPLTFLHTYHHGATAFLCYMQMVGQTPVSWVPITLNLAVHTVMYWYYFQSARGIRIWWKEYITIMQITQFVIDLGKSQTSVEKIRISANSIDFTVFIYFTSYNLFATKYFPSLWTYGSCDGGEPAAITGIVILTSYLFLFIVFFINTYYRKSSSSKKQRSGKVDTRSSASVAVKASAVDPLISHGIQALSEQVTRLPVLLTTQH